MAEAISDTRGSFKALVSSSEFEGLFFPGAGRKKAVDSLLHFARYGSMLLFLRGCEGSGRTAVLAEFAKAVDRDTQVIKIDNQVDNLLSFIADEVDRLALEINKLVEQVASLDVAGESEGGSAEIDEKLIEGSSAESPESAAARISKHLKRLASRGRRLVAVFDDAIVFTDDDLAGLIRLAEQNDGIFKLIFSGEEVQASRISELSERQTVLVNFIDLPVFTVNDGLAYIKYWLQAANFEDTAPYKEQQIEAALKRSEGSLNHFHNILSDTPMADAREQRSPMLPFPHLVAAIGLLLAIVLLWLFSGEEQSNIEDTDPIVLTKVDQPSSQQPIEQEREALSAAGIDSTSSGEKRSSEQELKQTAVAALATKQESDLIEDRLDSTSELAAANSSASKQDSKDVIVEAEKPAIVSQEAKVNKPNDVAVSPVTKPSDKAAKPASVAGVNVSESRAPTSRATTSRAKAVHDRLLAWPETGYALQVFGTHNAARAEQMVKDYFGRADLVFYETRHNDKPWFVVITGPFTGSEAARKGIAELPDGLRGLRPWPRNIASIHRDIRRYHGG